jgi:hypothetical protein
MDNTSAIYRKTMIIQKKMHSNVGREDFFIKIVLLARCFLLDPIKTCKCVS